MAKTYIPYDGDLVTREAARAAGLTRFFNGVLCKNGHRSQRLVSDGKCVGCMIARTKRHRARKLAQYHIDNAELLAEREARRAPEARKAQRNATLAVWREKNRVKLREYHAAWDDEHKDIVKGYAVARRDKKQEYDRDRYAANPQKAKEQSKAWRLKNQSRAVENVRNWQLANPDRRRAIANNWKASNREAVCEDARRRVAQERKATPPWADQAAILDIYTECSRITRETGIKHEVDHIVPLRHKNVCGLHVAWNMRIITAEENRKKNNKLLPGRCRVEHA